MRVMPGTSANCDGMSKKCVNGATYVIVELLATMEITRPEMVVANPGDPGGIVLDGAAVTVLLDGPWVTVPPLLAASPLEDVRVRVSVTTWITWEVRVKKRAGNECQ